MGTSTVAVAEVAVLVCVQGWTACFLYCTSFVVKFSL